MMMGVNVRKGMILEIHQPVAIVLNASGAPKPVRIYTDAAAILSRVMAKRVTAANETTSRTVLRSMPVGEIFFNRARTMAGETIDAIPIPITDIRWISGDCSVTSTEKTGFKKARGSARQPSRRMAARYKPAGG